MWRGLAFLLALCCCLALAGETVPARAGESDLMGDADCSGTVNPVDGLAVLRHDSGSAEAPCVDLADVQCDGDVDPIDALQLLRFDAGLEVTQDDGCTEIGEPVGPPPTSEELIASALAAGDITYETSLIYRAYALYADPRLPEAFQSPVIDLGSATTLAIEIEANRDAISAETLAEIEPFLARPNDPISIFNQPTALTSGPQPPMAYYSRPAAAKYRVWVRATSQEAADPELAEYSARVAMVVPEIAKLIAAPIQDNPAATPDLINPDDSIDIYFVDSGTVDFREDYCRQHPDDARLCLFSYNGWARPTAPFAGRTSSAYVFISTARVGSFLTSTLAHELFHVSQFTYDYKEDAWLGEATATWGAFRVLQNLNVSRAAVFTYLPPFFKRLDQMLTRNTEADRNAYASWLYFLYASMEKGDDIVKQIWETAAAEGVQGPNAVNDRFPFDFHFDNFTIRNWNQEPVSPLYRSPPPGDPTFPQGLRPEVTNIFFGTPGTESLEIGLEPLSAKYEAFTFDESVRTVVFENKWLGAANWHVWALVKIGNEWQEPADWTDETKMKYCRDREDENVTELVLIISNSHMADSITPPEDATVEGTADGCPGWFGTMKATTTWDLGFVGQRQYGESTTTFSGTWRSDLPEAEGYHPCHPFTEEPCFVHLAQGTISWAWNAHWQGSNPCDAVTNGQVPAGVYVVPHDQMFVVEPDGPDHYRYFGYGGWSGGPPPQDCRAEVGSGGGPPIFFDLPYNELPAAAVPAGTGVTRCEEVGWRVERTADTIQGTCYGGYFRYDGPDGYNHNSLVYEWELHRVGPAPEE
jgi:hypothetical protein